jgi:hypothetical protein
MYCAYPVLTFTNQHNSTLTLTNIIYAPDSGNQSLVTIQVNGAPVSFPYTILQGESIDILVEICGYPATWGMTLVTVEHNNDAQYQFPMTGINGSDLWDSLNIDFGNVPVGTSATVVRTITNIACDTQYVQFTTYFCASPSGLIQVGAGIGIPPLAVAPGATVPITLQWTPTSVGQVLNCNLFDSSALCTPFTATGLATEAPPASWIVNEGPLETNGNLNKMFCCYGCGYSENTFRNTYTENLTISDFVIDDASSGVVVSILSINGSSPSYPFIVAPDDTFVIEFEVCWDEVTSPLSPWTGHFVTQLGAELDLVFEMICLTPGTYGGWSSTSVNFADAIVGVPVTQSISCLSQYFFHSFTPTLSGCTGVTTNSPVSIFQNTGGTIDITWTPTTEGEVLSCTLDDNCGTIIDITGNSVAAPCEDCFCLLDLTIKTENDYIPPFSGAEDPSVIYNTASFLEKKTAVFSFIYPAGINSQWRFQFTPALFLTECFNPFEGPTISVPVHYAVTYLQSFMPDGTAQTMNLIGAGGNQLNVKNWECTFTPISAALGTFKIEFTFYQLQDIGLWMDSFLYDNLLKLKRSSRLSTIDWWQNTFTSVYNTNSQLGSAFMVIDPTILDENFNTTYCQVVNCANYTARFYDKGLYNGFAEFLNPTWNLSRSSGNVTNFSVLENTKIEFSITIPGAYSGFPICILHLFDITSVDNNVDFLTSSDSSRVRVLTYIGVGVLDNHFIRPGTVSLVGGAWNFSLYVDQNLNPNNQYRVAAIVYSGDGTMVNTFLSDIFDVTRYPDMNCECQPEIESKFLQYWQQTNSDCLRPVAKERIGHSLVVTDGEFTECMETLGLDGFDWKEQIQTVQLNIYKKIEGYPNPSKTTFFQYQTHKSIRNDAFFGGFQNLNDMLVGVGANEIFSRIINLRVPWEDLPFVGQVFTADTATYLNRTNIGSASSVAISANNVVQSWIDETVYFEYVFTFQLRDQVGEPFFWNIVKAFPVSAINLEPDNSGSENIITEVIIEGLDPITGLYVEIEEPICFKDWDAIKLTYQADREGNFIFFMEKEPFGFSTIVENNELNSHFGMTQLNNPLVLSMDTFYDPVTYQASVVLDAPRFDDATYRFCGYISEPQAPEACAYFMKFARFSGGGVTFSPTTQTVGTATVGFPTIVFGYLGLRASLGDTTFPVDGNTYVFEWNYASPTTLVTEVWFGRLIISGPPNLIIPIGSTSGSYSFIWNEIAGAGSILFRWQTGTPMTNTGVFKLGNQLCP